MKHATDRDDADRTPGEEYEAALTTPRVVEFSTALYELCPLSAPVQEPADDVGACACQQLATKLQPIWALQGQDLGKQLNRLSIPSHHGSCRSNG